MQVGGGLGGVVEGSAVSLRNEQRGRTCDGSGVADGRGGGGVCGQCVCLLQACPCIQTAVIV